MSGASQARARAALVILGWLAGFIGLMNLAVFWHGVLVVLLIAPLQWAGMCAWKWAKGVGS